MLIFDGVSHKVMTAQCLSDSKLKISLKLNNKTKTKQNKNKNKALKSVYFMKQISFIEQRELSQLIQHLNGGTFQNYVCNINK